MKDFFFLGPACVVIKLPRLVNFLHRRASKKKSPLLQWDNRAHTNSTRPAKKKKKNTKEKKRTQDELELFTRILRDGQGENHPTPVRRMHAKKKHRCAHPFTVFLCTAYIHGGRLALILTRGLPAGRAERDLKESRAYT